MASGRVKTQVIIVGGGITGLTLAVMLERLNIDFVLLEAYGTVTPNVGASIGLFANGHRILDQLGLYEEVYARAAPVNGNVLRDGKTGKEILTHCVSPVLKERHGYPQAFMERHQLLCVLHNGLRDKSRIFVNKKVKRVDSRAASALVYTEDGSVFEGQLVVGADGVHSTLRKEMWRYAEEKEPESIPARDKQNISCEHACIFGTADPLAGLNPGQVTGAPGHDCAAGLMVGPKSEVFFFWFWTLPKSMRSVPVGEIPRFTDEDKQREFARGADKIVADGGIRFGDVTKNLQFSAVSALPNFVLRRWHYGRLVVLGDAAHKFNPLVGQGGNSCMESCAALVNSLQEHLGSELSSKPAWDVDTLHQALVSLEKQRIDRLDLMVEQCQDAMRGVAWESWASELKSKYLVPLVPLPKFTDFYSGMITGAVSLKSLPPVKANHLWPYDDEVDPKSKAAPLVSSGVITAASVAAFTALIYASMNGNLSGILSPNILT